jgi:protein-tyrosine phosphatase
MSVAHDVERVRADGWPKPGQAIVLASVANLRDLGGWPTPAGATVRHGVLYRSTDLSRLDDDDATLGSLGIRAVYDLRTAAERELRPDRLPAGAAIVALDVLADAVQLAPAALFEVLEDPGLAREHLGDGRASAVFESAYRDLVRLPSARAAYGRLWRGLLREEGRPALVHCTTGKDRTGWAAASLLLSLGVPQEQVMEEYLLTNAALVPALAPVLERFAAAGGDPEILRPVLGVRPEYLRAALDEMRSRYGSLEAYLADGLGIDETAQAELRSLLLVPPD